MGSSDRSQFHGVCLATRPNDRRPMGQSCAVAGTSGLPPHARPGASGCEGAAIRGPGGKNMASTELTVKLTPNDNGNPPGKLADAELHFAGGPLDGLKLIGFSIWERRGGGGRNV